MAKKKKVDGPPCGQMVLDMASRYNMSWADAVQQLLFYRFDTTIAVRGGQRIPVSHMPGHLCGSGSPEPTPLPRGPQKSDVFVLTSHPNQMEERTQLFMSGSHGQEFRQACYAAGVDPSSWYVTGVCKFVYPQNRTSPLASWLADERYLLERELEIVSPKYILAMGAHAVKALFPDRKLKHIRGSVRHWKDALVLPTYSPHNVTAKPEVQTEFYRDIGAFSQLLSGTSPFFDYAVDIELLDTLEKLQAWVDRNMHHTIWSVDAEWGKDFTGKDRLRLIQLCAVPGKVAVVHLRSHGTKDDDMPVVMDELQAANILRPMLCRPEIRCVGHFYRSDLRRLVAIGLDIGPQFLRGFDTILGHHALYPTDEQQLELVANKLLGCDRYDLDIRAYIDNGKNKKLVEILAYATIPDDILIPYAAHDADKTLRLAGLLVQQLNLPENDGPRELVYGVTMPAGAGIFEMEQEGLRVDIERFQFLEQAYTQKKADLLVQVRAEFDWEEFNPGSPQQKIDLIFGSRYHDKKDDHGKSVQVRPADTPCLGLEPVKTTGKKPLYWDDVIKSKETHLYSPSTDDESLGILAVEDERLLTLRDYAYTAKVVSNFMAEPVKLGKRTINVKGLRAWMDDDGRVRTNISQLAETGRWKSFDPNMQNLPTQREADFQRIFDDPAWPGIKSMFVGDEDMPVLVEADLKTAEVVALAWLANDPDALNILMNPERDIHSEMAIKMFNLPYDSAHGVGTKKWCAGIASPVSGKVNKILAHPHNGGGEVWVGDTKVDVWPGLNIVVSEGQSITDGHPITESHKQLRVAAKTVVFGIPYGRGPRALAREISQFGTECTKSSAQGYINEYMTNFKKIAEFLEFCKNSVYDPGYLRSVYGRMRWFFSVSNQSSMKAQEREATNWFVQGLVAEVVSKAVAKFHAAHTWSERPFRLKLAVHDSAVLTCRGQDAQYICEEVVARCLSTDNLVPKLNFRFGVETSLHTRLSTKASHDELEAVGVPAGYWPQDVEASTGPESGFNNPYPTARVA